ncbi:protein kinase [Corallococcus sp. bb12-1]|uniref:serine/threonine protein kinase n=1 Tax=Corallococcus sp. bb12-1 TaxID=2996784 RepID=UPI00226F6BC2|nr:serine/threonine protein kinase [Corallococcus sp. bb12-1]MCY1043466.1 protein kinase [Corallococcus sp. bb12-1]
METFGRYELLRKLATGGMGAVYLARQKGPVGFQKLLVVKRLLPHLSEDDEFLQMFLDEARIAALLNHPNIAQIYEMGDVDGQYYIAMEYVHGEPLGSLVPRASAHPGGFPLGLRCRIIAEAAAGLDAAHNARSPSGRKLSLIHRDVSPQNVLVGFNGGVKLIDFGVAKAQGKLSQTVVGTIKGKHAYMSPEQARGEPLDARSDVFGLGTVFYELLTNGRLFKRESEMATLKAVVGFKIVPPSEAVPGIPKSLDAIVFKALARKRDDRFSTAGELQLALEEFLQQEKLHGTSAHLAAFMRDVYADELEEERFAAEPTMIYFDPRLMARPGAAAPKVTGTLPAQGKAPAKPPSPEPSAVSQSSTKAAATPEDSGVARPPERPVRTKENSGLSRPEARPVRTRENTGLSHADTRPVRGDEDAGRTGEKSAGSTPEGPVAFRPTAKPVRTSEGASGSRSAAKAVRTSEDADSRSAPKPVRAQEEAADSRAAPKPVRALEGAADSRSASKPVRAAEDSVGGKVPAKGARASEGSVSNARRPTRGNGPDSDK